MQLSYRDRIRRAAEVRNVQLIFHFTQAANLPGIVQHGLLPREILQNAPYEVFASNTYRLDGNADWLG